jgi:FKBP-type peptidyl-prolyl cis-trans isomerase (trigger factor)
MYCEYTDGTNGNNYFRCPLSYEDMPTIKIGDWTKSELEEIKEQEDHTSLDSVIKSLLKERQVSTEDTNND